MASLPSFKAFGPGNTPVTDNIHRIPNISTFLRQKVLSESAIDSSTPMSSNNAFGPALQLHSPKKERDDQENSALLASLLNSILHTSDDLLTLIEYKDMCQTTMRERRAEIWRMEVEEKLRQMVMDDKSLSSMLNLVMLMEPELSKRDTLILVFEAVKFVETKTMDCLVQESLEFENISDDVAGSDNDDDPHNDKRDSHDHDLHDVGDMKNMRFLVQKLLESNDDASDSEEYGNIGPVSQELVEVDDYAVPLLEDKMDKLDTITNNASEIMRQDLSDGRSNGDTEMVDRDVLLEIMTTQPADSSVQLDNSGDCDVDTGTSESVPVPAENLPNASFNDIVETIDEVEEIGHDGDAQSNDETQSEKGKARVLVEHVNVEAEEDVTWAAQTLLSVHDSPTPQFDLTTLKSTTARLIPDDELDNGDGSGDNFSDDGEATHEDDNPHLRTDSLTRDESDVLIEKVDDFCAIVRQPSIEINPQTKPGHDTDPTLSNQDQCKPAFHSSCSQTCQVFTQLLVVIRAADISPSLFFKGVAYNLSLLPDHKVLATAKNDEATPEREGMMCILNFAEDPLPRTLVESMNEALEDICESFIASAGVEEKTTSEEQDTFLAGMRDLLAHGKLVLQNPLYTLPGEIATAEAGVPSTPRTRKNKNKKKKKKKEQDNAEAVKLDSPPDGATFREYLAMLYSNAVRVSSSGKEKEGTIPRTEQKIYDTWTEALIKMQEMTHALEFGLEWLNPPTLEQNCLPEEAAPGSREILEAMAELTKLGSKMSDRSNAPLGILLVKKYQDLVDGLKMLQLMSKKAADMTVPELQESLSKLASEGAAETPILTQDSSIKGLDQIELLAGTRVLQIKLGQRLQLPAEPVNLADLCKFNAYVEKTFPPRLWSVTRLSDSPFSYTVRVERISKDEGAQKTRVVKYLRSFHPDGMSALDRQRIAGYGLKAFAIYPADKCSELNHEVLNHEVLARTWVPQVISEDSKNHIIVMHDVGFDQTLAATVDHFRSLDSPVVGVSEKDLNTIGYDLGWYFAMLHSTASKGYLEEERGHKVPNISSNAGHMRRIKVDPIVERLQAFDVSNSEQLGQRAAKDFDAKFEADFEVFALGNANLNSILIENPIFGDNHKAIRDWECCGWGRGINGDMACLFADMFLYLTAPNPTAAITFVIKSLMDGIAEGYSLCSVTYGSTLIMSEGKRIAAFGGSKRRLPPKVARSLRSLFIACGRELIYLAFNLPRACLCCKPGERIDCKWVKTTVELGATCLRLAGRSEHDFQSAKNWKHVCDSCSLHSWLLSLVFPGAGRKARDGFCL